ncbi:endonuclease/exonuclease/phosphatase family protein [Sinomicrobium kalidii]|uniref:endonuclease/exonuclease/phosphatase family protein n=1 Tax=Sinomicrobium kalidii TaxID=2900738 RepID=UPI001E2D7DB1|nr:endonuclease/exonuclease/phosphatase family protein [Sinomicrobium kalidii]UGU14201.1 endonuclease/exonuclease/phosphatase family protein [Sinomicrobium kalidii]
MTKYLSLLFLSTYLLPAPVKAQKKYTVKTVAFYNTENLFDTISNSPADEERTPSGNYKWTSERYMDKIAKLSRVISEIGADVTGTAPDIVGLAEVENGMVLRDLIRNKALRNYDYGIVHVNSPDHRGIDVAMLYRKKTFTPIHFKNIPLKIEDEEGNRRYTRDQLLVTGILDGEPLHIIVNHWPSRYGGENKSKPNRMAAAQLNKKIIDSLLLSDPQAKIISMGDLNDDPSDPSLKKILKTKSGKTKLKTGELYNPMEALSREGFGTLAHRDRWHLFDQIFFTAELLKENKSSYRYWKTGIFNKRYLITASGPYRGYPLRSYSRGQYSGGYSDHFPVYIYLVKPTAP